MISWICLELQQNKVEVDCKVLVNTEAELLYGRKLLYQSFYLYVCLKMSLKVKFKIYYITEVKVLYYPLFYLLNSSE